MKNPTLAILLPQQLPQEVLAFLDGYIVEIGGNHFLFSDCFDVEGYFVSLNILKKDKSKKAWQVRLPIQYVLGVAHMREGDKNKIGFSS